jgi:hypothetical protein
MIPGISTGGGGISNETASSATAKTGAIGFGDFGGASLVFGNSGTSGGNNLLYIALAGIAVAGVFLLKKK